MANTQYTLNIQVLHSGKEKTSQFLIEAWDWDKEGDDNFLGKTISDENGRCQIVFPLEYAGDSPDIYFKVYEKDRLVYNSKNDVVYWGLTMPILDVVLRIDGSRGEYPIPSVPIKATHLSIKLDDISSLSEGEQVYINIKLEGHLKDTLFSYLNIGDAAVEDAIRDISLPLKDYGDKPLHSLIEEVILPELKCNPVAAAFLEGRPNLILRDNRTPIKEVLQLEKPIKKHPAFAGEVRKIKTYTLVDIALNDHVVASQIAREEIDLEFAFATDWKGLIEKGILTEETALTTKKAYEFAKVTGDNFGLVKILKANKKVSQLRDLAKWKKEDWTKSLAKIEGETPNGEDAEVYVRNVMRVVEKNFPSDFFMTRVVDKGRHQVFDALESTAALQEKNSELFTNKDISWGKLGKNRQNELKEKIAQVRRVGNTYKHLGVQEIFNSSKTPKQKETDFKKAVGVLDKFYQNNPDVDVLRSNFIKNADNPETKLNWEGITKEMRPKVQRQLLAFQRVRSIASDFETSSKLMETGYDSAYRVAYEGKSAFMAKSGLSKVEASVVYAKAQEKTAQAVNQYHSIVELHHNQRLGLRVDNTITQRPSGFVMSSDGIGDTTPPEIPSSLYDQVRNELKDIDGFEELFGAQNFCQCDHCKSIFSPAAYFVDLMHFVEQEVTVYSSSPYNSLPNDSKSIPEIFEGNADPDHPLWLLNRRPDLENLELTCENTYKMIPYLQIVYEVKEAYIKRLWALEASAGLQTNSEDVFEELATNPRHRIYFNAPSSKALAEANILLDHFDTNLEEIVDLTDQTLLDDVAAYFGLGHFQLEASDDPYRLFGNRQVFTELAVTEFLKHAKISRGELQQVLATNYVGINATIIVTATEVDPGIQYSAEVLEGIEEKGLGYLHHFILLWKQLDITIPELDLIFDYIDTKLTYGSVPYSVNHLIELYHVLRLKEYLEVSVEEVIGIIHKLTNKSLKTIERKDPMTGELVEEATPGYLDRRFNMERMFGSNGSGTINPNDVNDEQKLSLFLAGLGISLEHFQLLQSFIDPSQTNALSRGSLSEYFKHFQLAKKLKLSLQEWLLVLQLKEIVWAEPESILEVSKWVKTQQDSPFSFTELILLNTPGSEFITKEEIATGLHHSEPPVFEASIFTSIDNDFNETVVVDILGRLVSDELISEKEAGVYQMVPTFEWAQLEDSVASATSANSASFWNTHGEAIALALSPYHSLISISNLYLKVEDFATQVELGNLDVHVLLENLNSDGRITTTPDKVHFRVETSYDTTSVDSFITTLDTEATDTSTTQARTQSLKATISSIQNSFEKIDEYLQVGKALPRTAYNDLWAAFTGFDSEYVEALLPMMTNTWEIDFEKLFADTNEPDFAIPVGVFDFINEMKRYALIFGNLGLPSSSIEFVRINASDVFDIANIQALTLENLDTLTAYKSWLDLDTEAVDERLHPMLLEIKTSTEKVATAEAFRHYFDLPENLLTDIEQAQQISTSFGIAAGSSAVSFAEELKDKTELCAKLGLRYSQLDVHVSSQHTKLQAFADSLRNTIAARSESEESLEETLEPLDAKLQEVKRDILCDYILARDEVHFDDANELYAFFLLDPQMSGCMKISRIVAGHLSLQLYVHRVLMNLELNELIIFNNDRDRTASRNDSFKAFLNPEVYEQWEWRKNYRVWEANRKVGVYPENFIEPEWRDNKSPEFKQLEEELLQQKITLESAEQAYKEYLKKFVDLGKLVVSGVHFDDSDYEKPVYHIFGRTSTDPKIYYYRTYKSYRNYATYTIGDDEHGEWTPWKKVNLPINSERVSPIKFQDKIYVLWVETVSRRHEDFVRGSTAFRHYENSINVKYSYQDLNGQWIQPQLIKNLDSEDNQLSQIKVEGLSIASNSKQEFDHYSESKSYNLVYPYIKNRQSGNKIIKGLRLGYIQERKFGEDNFSGWNFDVDLYKNKAVHNWGGQAGPYLSKFILIIYGETDGIHLAVTRKPEDHKEDGHIDRRLRRSENPKTAVSSTIIDENFLELNTVHNKPGDFTLTAGNEQLLITNRHVTYAASSFRLNTTIPDYLSRIMHESANGISSLFNIKNQTKSEDVFPVDFTSNSILQGPVEPFNSLPFDGAYGIYFRELFYHIPSLIADHLNSEGKYKDADWWYRKVFDPTATEDVSVTNSIDRNWQYLEFRNQDPPRYSANLTNPTFLNTYKNDPFNPHAIARLRISAYQKATVLKYIDNLLDWGDSLFRKFQFESINEAMMLYILAQDILGDRPHELHKCQTAAEFKVTYNDIREELGVGNEFLIWLENEQEVLVEGESNLSQVSESSSRYETEATFGSNTQNTLRTTRESRRRTYSYDDLSELSRDISRTESGAAYTYTTRDGQLMYVQNITTRKLLFCVPMNKEILGLWDRVEDRLFKIRHCMNIDGVKQTLSLFAPPIDPRLLVAARSSGLSIADAIASLDALVPHYRFSYMVEKAKSYAGTVQGFGGALLSALEKKDGEELTLLRSIHEQNILKQTEDLKNESINESISAIENLEEVKRNIEVRVDYYSNLIDTGLLSEEIQQQKLRDDAGAEEDNASVHRILASYYRMYPQVGSPPAMTFGGQQVGHAMDMFASSYSSNAAILMRSAERSGVKGGEKRREAEWNQQLDTAKQEIKAIEKQIIVAKIRQAIAEKDLEIHKQQIAQSKELYDFYKDKFSSFGLYKYMATTMSRLFGQAYNLAFDMAKQAEKCYQFETDNQTFFIQNDNWDAGHAGLLAGERLSLQLMRMEKAFTEKTPRREEITQSFSLRMLDGEQLVNLQKNGECNFMIPEWAFDISYPGHYRRTIKSVRITIPCVAGPYTNVACRLSLSQNKIRTKPLAGEEYLFAGPNFANGSISTSSANNDGGQFELNFNDARYLPFEGGGAAESEWVLSLPKAIKAFDYNTISDAIIHISYTALYDSALKSEVESFQESQQESVRQQLIATPHLRLISLKEEFPDALYQLQSDEGTVTVSLEEKHFPSMIFRSGLTIANVNSVKYWDGEAFVAASSKVEDIPGELVIDFADLIEGDVVLLVEYGVG